MATIIKREAQFSASGADIRNVAFDLTDMESQADAYLTEVRSEAAKIVREAEQDAAKIRQQSELAGKQAAEAAIERILDEKVAKQMKTLTPALALAVKQIEDSRQEWLRHWEQSAIRLACEIAARLTRRELTSQPEIALDWIRDALRMSAGSGEVTLRLNPTDYETLGTQVQQLVDVFQTSATANILGDTNISPGGCRIETEFGAVDHQLETQLERLQEELS
ncbi:MAG: FliH/SctL family protein [Planctomycetota bacterium]